MPTAEITDQLMNICHCFLNIRMSTAMGTPINAANGQPEMYIRQECYELASRNYLETSNMV